MFRRRIWMLVALVVASAVALLVRLYHVQIVDGPARRAIAEERLRHRESVHAPRGAIFDRRGIPLVTNEPAYHLGIRVGYFERGSPAGVVRSVLDAVRRAADGNGEPVRLVEVASDPDRFATRLLRETRRRDLLAVPGRRHRYELYRRLVGLLDVERRSLLVAALERAPGDATLEEVLTRFGAGGHAIAKRPLETAVAKIREEGVRLADLAARLGTTHAALVQGIEGAVAATEAAVERAVERELAEPVEHPDLDPAARLHDARYDARQDHPFRVRALYRDIEPGLARALFLDEDRYPGFLVEESWLRQFLAGTPVSIVGYLGELWPDLRERAKRDLRDAARGEPPAGMTARGLAWRRHLVSLEAGDRVGLSGLERTYDADLRGGDGTLVIRRDFFGRGGEVLRYEPPVPGCDLHLHLDLELTNRLERILEETAEADLAEGRPGGGAGALILMDPHDGSIFAMASHPRPSSAESREDLAARRDDPLRSALDRCVRQPRFAYPGSTFKIVGAVAALEEGRVDASTTHYCRGYLREPLSFRCMGTHGDANLQLAMEKSCNVFFYHLGEELGGTTLAEWARRFGFGERTGIEVFEDPGRLFSPADPGPDPWTPGDARKLAIGQVNVEATPLQVLCMAAAIANGGKRVRPRLVSYGPGTDSLLDRPARDVGMSPPTLRAVRGMLEDVVERGTAEGYGLARFRTAGKTGTAETYEDGPEHAWFVGYAPADRPRVALVAFRELCGLHGGEGAAPLAAAALEAFLEHFGEN